LTAISTVLTDIEGTTTSIEFVTETLFPYARAHLAGFLVAQRSSPAVQRIRAEVERLADRHALSDDDLVGTLEAWMNADRKAPPLKELQGLIWAEGYASGQLVGHVYEDAAAALRDWHTAGLSLYVFSSGSERAQRLLFAHSRAGDLGSLFSGHFDTRVGSKQSAASYRAIAERIGCAPAAILFLSDVSSELDAAAAAGMQTTWVVRHSREVVDARHARVRSLGEVQVRR